MTEKLEIFLTICVVFSTAVNRMEKGKQRKTYGKGIDVCVWSFIAWDFRKMRYAKGVYRGRISLRDNQKHFSL